jgi:hypothetical protein
MSKCTVSRWSAVWFMASCFLWASLSKGASPAGEPRQAFTPDPRLDMVAALKAMGPNQSLGDQAKVFDRLIGTWDVELTDFSKNGKATHRSGEFIVGWVMDGRVIQEFWIVDPSGTRTDREVYTELRYYDPKSGTWASTFIDPEHASVARFTGGAAADDRIALDSHDFNGTDTRWSINDIRPDSFVWREEESLDGGKTWRLLAEHHMKRRRAALPAS